MKIHYVSLCSWAFDKKGEIYNPKTFTLLSNKQKEKIIDERLNFLSEVLNILKTEKILLVNKLEINVADVKDEYLFDNPDIDFTLSRFKSDILHNPNGDLFSCYAQGLTIINTINGEEKVESLMDLSYSFGRNGIDIMTYSDLWSPMDLDDNYQIDLAVLNNPRLERCLQKIKALGDYSYICPDEGEFGDDKLAQFGFRVITSQGDITKWDDFPKEQKENVKPFISKYITGH